MNETDRPPEADRPPDPTPDPPEADRPPDPTPEPPEADRPPDPTPEPPTAAGGASSPVPSPTRSPGPMTMAEYEEASSPRAQLARARGLAAPYIPGGRDPDPEQGLREERRYMRLLIAMVVAIVGGGFALSILYVLVTGGN